MKARESAQSPPTKPQNHIRGVTPRRKFPESVSKVPRCALAPPMSPASAAPQTFPALRFAGRKVLEPQKFLERGSICLQSQRNVRNAVSCIYIWAQTWRSPEPGVDFSVCSRRGGVRSSAGASSNLAFIVGMFGSAFIMHASGEVKQTNCAFHRQ